MTTLIRTFTSPSLQRAHDDARATSSDVLGWRLGDGAEVLRIGRRLLVAVRDVVIERHDIPIDVPVSTLVAEMRAGGAS